MASSCFRSMEVILDLKLLRKVGGTFPLLPLPSQELGWKLFHLRFASQPTAGSFPSLVRCVPSEMPLDFGLFGTAFSSCLGHFLSLVTCLPSVCLDPPEGSL